MKKQNRQFGKIALWVGRLTLMLAGILLWLWVFDLIWASLDPALEEWVKIVCMFAGAILLGIVFFFSAPPIVGGLFKLYRVIEKSLTNYTGRQIVMGVIGLILGLVLVLLFNLIYFLAFNQKQIKFFPLPVNIILCIVFGFVGLMLGVRRMGEHQNKNADTAAEDGGQAAPAAPARSPKILDSSAIIDGRILDVARTGFVEGPFIIPNFVLNELRHITDSSDPLKRNRGKRGIEVIDMLQKESGIEVEISGKDYEEGDTDSKLLRLAEQLGAGIITNDYNLNKIASLKKIKVLNINELSNAIKPVALPGEKMKLKLVKEGKEYGQAVGYLADGTMIVVENGGKFVGQEVEVTITTALQTAAGRMIFGRIM